jgi:hypothetical protein
VQGGDKNDDLAHYEGRNVQGDDKNDDLAHHMDKNSSNKKDPRISGDLALPV